MKNEITTGKCLCESIKFKIHGNPLWVSHCHCQSCRRNTGSVVATFVGLRKEQLSYITGSRKFTNLRLEFIVDFVQIVGHH